MARKQTAYAKAVQFFSKHAGGSYTPGKETRAQGKRRLAQRLAKAEREAFSRGWRVDWDQEMDPDLSWCDECSSGEHDKYEHMNSTESAVLRDEEGRVLASLGNIDRPDRNYRRLVEAELADEALAGEE